MADFPGTKKPATRTAVEPAAPPDERAAARHRKTGPITEKQNMSNAQPDTRGAGGERRRNRSRGGKGRNRNRQNDGSTEPGNQNRGERGERGEHGERRNHGGNRGDRGERQPRTDRDERGPRPPRKEYKPAPLTLWQKILKIFGLYKEPVRPPRPERKESVRFEEGPPREVKSNTRNARQPGAEGPQQRSERPERQERPDRQERPERSERSERRSSERSEVASSRIYLGNLSYEASEEDLKDLFKGIGTVRNVEIVYNRRTHRSKGYGFVDMLNTEEARRSVEVLHDQFFMGRKLVVSGAKSKEHEDAVREEMPEPRAAQVVAPAPAPAAEVETSIFEEPAAIEEEAPVEVAEIAPVTEDDEPKA